MILSSGIYSITNTLNNKVYFGSAKNISRRWLEHQKDLEDNTHSNKHLQRAYNKKTKLEYKILFYCDVSNLLFYEQKLLDQNWDNGVSCYNICKLAGSMLGFRHSKETKDKMSRERLGKPGKPHTEQTKQALSTYRAGKQVSNETKCKMSNSRGNNPTHSKLILVEVKEIRDLLKSNLFTYTKIASFYKVSRTTISKIDKNISWVK
jgi:group I intron endonuclease